MQTNSRLSLKYTTNLTKNDVTGTRNKQVALKFPLNLLLKYKITTYYAKVLSKPIGITCSHIYGSATSHKITDSEISYLDFIMHIRNVISVQFINDNLVW